MLYSILRCYMQVYIVYTNELNLMYIFVTICNKGLDKKRIHIGTQIIVILALAICASLLIVVTALLTLQLRGQTSQSRQRQKVIGN